MLHCTWFQSVCSECLVEGKRQESFEWLDFMLTLDVESGAFDKGLEVRDFLPTNPTTE